MLLGGTKKSFDEKYIKKAGLYVCVNGCSLISCLDARKQQLHLLY